MRKMRGDNDSGGSFWISYSDLTTGVLLIFILIVVVKTNDLAEKEQEANALTERATALAEEAQDERQKAEALQKKVIDLREQAEALLNSRQTFADKLERAVDKTNDELGETVFHFNGDEVFVRMEKSNRWFEPSQRILSDGQGGQPVKQIRTFYRHLFDELLRDTEGAPHIPEFLSAINIEGHTAAIRERGGNVPTPRSERRVDYSSERYRGGLNLSQGRALSVVEAILAGYKEGRPGFDESRPWQLFAALVTVSGRSWTRCFCPDDPGQHLEPSDIARSPQAPCKQPESPSAHTAAQNSSRRVTFGFKLNDEALLEALKRKLATADTDTPSGAAPPSDAADDTADEGVLGNPESSDTQGDTRVEGSADEL